VETLCTNGNCGRPATIKVADWQDAEELALCEFCFSMFLQDLLHDVLLGSVQQSRSDRFCAPE